MKDEKCKIYLEPNIKICLLYMDDCIRGIIEFLEAGNSSLKKRVYNINGFSATPEDLVKETKK
jgi:hypothetical protein